MKFKSSVMSLIAITFTLMIILSSCNNSNIAGQTTLHLSQMMCEASLNGITPKRFCETKGQNTFLEGRYLRAEVDSDGCLILVLKDEVISEWKNTFTDLQILQCVLKDTRDIGVIIDYSKDFMGYMEDAHTCGFEISEDFSKVIDSPEDNSWYYPFIVSACLKMQMFEGKLCSEIKVEYIEINIYGEIIETTIITDNAENN